MCICAVIFDAGLSASSDSWSLVYQETIKFTKVVDCGTIEIKAELEICSLVPSLQQN